MEITSNQVKSIAMIGFDTLKGPVIEWQKCLTKDFELDIQQFCTPFYLMFQSGNGLRPRAIFFENFSVVAFPDEMNLLCLFLADMTSKQNFDALFKFAQRYLPKDSDTKPKENTVKDQMMDVLHEQQKMTISDLGKFFNFNKKTIRNYLLELVLSGKVKRDGKKGRETIWAINTE